MAAPARGAAISLRRRSRCCFGGLHGHRGAATGASVEGNPAVRLGEQGMILADTDIGAGVELGAALADQNVAGDHDLLAELLHAQPLAGGIAAVARTAACFLMCHCVVLLTRTSSGVDASDLQRRQL